MRLYSVEVHAYQEAAASQTQRPCAVWVMGVWLARFYVHRGGTQGGQDAIRTKGFGLAIA
jgi:hypothetical protein